MTTPSVIASEARQSIPASQPILPWLAMLAHLYPPKATLLIGAGAGTSPWVKHLQTANHPNVTLIEADEVKVNRLKTATQNQPSWQVKQHVIAQHTAPTQFYTASLQTESGLLEPDSLRSLWPNLKTTHLQTHQPISLAELQPDAENPSNWLLVDCLPALPILQGAAQQLADFDVIAARVLLQDTAPHNNAATVDQLQLALAALGFQCVAIETSRHPAIGHALFVRDTAAQAQAAADQLAAERQAHDAELQQLIDAAEQAKTEAADAARDQAAANSLATERLIEFAALKTQYDTSLQEKIKLNADRAELAKINDQLGAQLAAEIKAKSDALAQRDVLAKEKVALTAARDEQTKLAVERQQATAAQASQLHHQLSQQAQTHQEQTQAEAKSVAQAKATADKLAAERLAQAQALEQRLKQIQAQSADANHLRQLLQIELSKAEAQIELLKEIFISESGQ